MAIGINDRSGALGSRRSRWVARLQVIVIAAVTLCVVPRAICSTGAQALYDGRLDAQLPLARAVAARAGTPLRFETGNPRFDGEWSFVTRQMSVIGLGQIACLYPDQREAMLPAMEASLDAMLTPEALAFGTEDWKMRGLSFDRVAPPAWLGYLGTALGMHRMVAPRSRFSGLHDRLIAALARRLDEEPLEAIATYPDETYPPDIATVIGAVGLWQRATGRSDHQRALARSCAAFRARAVDVSTGLVFQALETRSGAPLDKPRASGTAFSVYFLAFADPALSSDLYRALHGRCYWRLAGFGLVDEYPTGVTAGGGDVDSGPVILGVGSSATAFTIAGARVHGDKDAFVSLARTATLLGSPVEGGGQRRYVLGGALADAVMLTMGTAPAVKAP